ncbi:hypothetical protein HPO96_05535 [Kribbella sandramycini]|uniref:ABC-type uncharacterized transport system permease subunit n=1 Tax=Kribbella sandramycini TaxID=60450 RepID=A0A7Y4KXI2_9ACTN|nr:ABC-2 family transporter protein [Kribbella sandramycini]MBB6567698.1 ABC-type uncharacterized transport system permease subunit [Kribbella sandramycini]NOL39701.1 hypothetical protein [Kribbella sandramycini]
MIRLGSTNALFFRANLALSMVSVALQTVLLVTVWRAVYSGHGQVAGINEADAVSYAVIAMLLWHIALPWQLSSIPDRVREGTVATDLIRPIGVVGQSLLQAVGATVGAIPGVMVGLAVAFAFGGLEPPASTGALGGFLLTAALGWSIAAMLNIAVSMVAFWTTDTRGPFYIYRAVASFASGALIPLWFMPTWLRPLLDALPFGLQVFAPLQLWHGQEPIGRLWAVLATQLAWLAAAAAIVALVSWRALRKVVINGG